MTRLALFAVSLILLTACSSDPDGSRAQRDAPRLSQPIRDGVFVKAAGTSLTLDGRPYYFIGVNVWGLASDPAVFNCAGLTEPHQQYLDRVFADLTSKGIYSVRFFALQSYTAGRGDLTAIRRVIDTARRFGVRVIPVLGNNYADCDYYPRDAGGFVKDATWYRDGYKRPYSGYQLSYRDYAAWVVQQFRDDPAVMMWQLVNEAHVSSEQDASVLRNFAADMAQLVKSLDPNHLVSAGTQGTGQAGIQGVEFRALHALEDVDIVEAHDYDRDDEPLPGYPSCTANCIWSAMRDARDLNKPFFIGEAGVVAGDAPQCMTTAQRRADILQGKAEAMFQQGGAGYVFWEYSGNPRRQPCSYEIEANDPLFGRIEAIAASIPKQPAR